MSNLKNFLNKYFINSENYVKQLEILLNLISDTYECLEIDIDEYITFEKLVEDINLKMEKEFDFVEELKVHNDIQQNIRKIQELYGLLTFRLAIIFLIDIGHRALNNINNIEDMYKVIKETTLISYDEQCNIVKCAKELSAFKILSLIKYIKSDFYLDFKDMTI